MVRYFFCLQNDKMRSSASEDLISDIKFQNMLNTLIFRILETEPSFVSIRQESTTPDVIENCSTPHKPSLEKYRKDIEALQGRYGDSFSTGFCIEIPLKELLELCPRERHRKDAYHGLVSYLKNNLGITLTIKSQKTK